MNTGGEDEASNSIAGDKSFKTAQDSSECSSRPPQAPGSQPMSPELLRNMQMHALMEFVWGLQWTNTKASEKAERVSEAYAANLHSRRCDAARDRQSALNDKALSSWRESSKFWPLDVERWLNSASARPEAAENPLTSFSGLVWLDPQDIDTLASLMIADLLRSAHRSHLLERMSRVVYTATIGLDKHLATERLKGSLATEMDGVIASLKTACVNYCILAFECAQFFGQDLVELSPIEIIKNLHNLLESSAGLHMLPAFVAGMAEADQTAHLEAFWETLYLDLEPICISSPQTKTINSLTILAGIPLMRSILVKKSIWFVRGSQLYSMIISTVLGRMISGVSMADFLQNPNSAVTEKMKTYIHPQGISANLASYLSMIEVAQENHIKSCVQFIKLFLKHGGEVRQGVLDWFSRIIELNIEQTKLYIRASQQTIVRMTPAAQNWMFYTSKTMPYSISFNICWVLMDLCVPIAIEKIKDVDALFGEYCRIHCDKGGVMAESWLSETRMKSDEHLDTLSQKNVPDKEPKFITQIFWLTLKAQKMLFYQCVNDALQRQIQLVQIVTDAGEAPADPTMKERLCAEVILWQSLLRLDDFDTAYLHFVDLLNAFIARSIFLSTKKSSDGSHPNSICAGLGIPAQVTLPEKEEDVSLEFQSLPVEYISDTYEAFSKYISISMTPTFMRPSTMTIENAFNATNCELFSIVLFTILGGSDHLITAPAMRLDIGGRCLASLGNCKTLRNRVCSNSSASQLLAPSICLGFVHAQKLSYYSRIDMRLILTRELERLLPDQSFRDSMELLAGSNQADFERFLLFLSSNISYVLEEALTYLTEIKSRESRQSTTASQNPSVPIEPSSQPTNSVRGMADDEEAFAREADRVAQEVEGTRNVEEMNFEQLTSQCQNFMAAGSASLNAFSQLDSRCFEFIRNNKILIDPTVSCLDSCLASLVGPKCMALKVTNFSKYNFNPRELLADLVKIYVKFIGDDPAAQVLKAIRDDQRFYSKKLFDKAVRIVKREGLTAELTTRKFEELVDQLNAGDEENDWIDELIMSGEVPDEFIDPLMSDIMRDPVMLPTSNVIVERSVIERHLLSDQFDPFNRKPLDRSMLQSQDDLRSRIEEFLEKAKERRLH